MKGGWGAPDPGHVTAAKDMKKSNQIDKIYEKIKLWLSKDRLNPKMVNGTDKDKALKARKIRAERKI